MLDTGAGVSVAPKFCFKNFPMKVTGASYELRTASGAPITVFGEKDVTFYFRTLGSIMIRFIIAEVTRPLLSMKDLLDQGCTVLLNGHESVLNLEGRKFPLIYKDQLYFVKRKNRKLITKIRNENTLVKFNKKTNSANLVGAVDQQDDPVEEMDQPDELLIPEDYGNVYNPGRIPWDDPEFIHNDGYESDYSRFSQEEANLREYGRIVHAPERPDEATVADHNITLAV